MSARQRHLLPLAARQLDTVVEAFAQHLIVALRYALDDGVGQAALRGLPNASLVPQRFDLADADIFAHDKIISHEILEDDADVLSQTVQVVIPEIDAVEQNAPLVGVVEAREQLHQRRLARTVLPHQSDALVRLECERESAHRPPLRARIPETDVLESETGLQRARYRRGAGLRNNTGLYIEEREQIA